MHLLLNLLLVLQLLTALIMIGLVLVQHGKGADMGASFGSGASGSLFGATGSANFLSRSTAICAAVFFVCTLILAYYGMARTESDGASILDVPSLPASAPAASAAPAALAPAASAAVEAPAASAAASNASQVSGR
ncbi:MAG TPA: preprotein translocase subunit SecG [Burkholderiaceae bacterium]|nr:preprotein translocase subunit SecG [Burkholderiaceae bacterium]